LRGDDGAAPLAVEALPADVRALAEIVEMGQLSVEALLDVPASAAVVVADAAVGVAPGRVVTMTLESIAGGAAGAAPAPASSHSIPPDQVLALAAELRGAAIRGVFVGLGGADFGLGHGLSEPVAAALPSFATAIAAAIRRLSSDAP
jgi:hydrogenase maturation protease